ncbi:MAG TPA: DAK2 domain-containing protein [Clostridiales bacterium]|nr:DAK2 domain-containing protein [Clostridiales bacterium]
MVTKTIDAITFKKAFISGAKRIESKKEYINELNVFPVPDGDTGTNMTLTIQAAVNEVLKLENPTVSDIAKAISNGSLRGARGNSGVILSQLFRGFAKEVRANNNFNTTVMANAMVRGAETAYKAVIKPKEGTILTVAKGAANKAVELAKKTDDLIYFSTEVIKHMEEVLEQTPELLPVLKEAGVVDSGGQGLLEICIGFHNFITDKEIIDDLEIETITPKFITPKHIESVDIKFAYCTEFIINVEGSFKKKDEDSLKSYLGTAGDSLVVVSDEDIVKVHVHTNDPGIVLQEALTIGSLSNIKIDNMREEHNEKLIKDAQKLADEEKKAEEPRKDVGFIAVSSGEGLSDIFKGLGVDYIIEGGQTMNPSTDDMLNAIDKVNADNIFILPNNSNIILTANQSKDIVDDKNIIVIPSKTIPQGIAAVINYIYDASIHENAKRMTEEMYYIKSGQVTYAVRDTAVNGTKINQGDIMGLDDKNIISVGEDVSDTTLELIDNLIEEESDLISLYYGTAVDKNDAEELAKRIEEIYPGIEVELNYGGQPIYYYFLSIE